MYICIHLCVCICKYIYISLSLSIYIYIICLPQYTRTAGGAVSREVYFNVELPIQNILQALLSFGLFISTLEINIVRNGDAHSALAAAVSVSLHLSLPPCLRSRPANYCGFLFQHYDTTPQYFPSSLVFHSFIFTISSVLDINIVRNGDAHSALAAAVSVSLHLSLPPCLRSRPANYCGFLFQHYDTTPQYFPSSLVFHSFIFTISSVLDINIVRNGAAHSALAAAVSVSLRPCLPPLPPQPACKL